MDDRAPVRLPIHSPHGEADDAAEPACSPKIYVSNEEASVLREMRALRERVLALRSELDAASQPRRRELGQELEALRASRRLLERRREEAYRRKMVMLGHLPPEALDEEIEP
jgi:transposase